MPDLQFAHLAHQPDRERDRRGGGSRLRLAAACDDARARQASCHRAVELSRPAASDRACGGTRRAGVDRGACSAISARRVSMSNRSTDSLGQALRQRDVDLERRRTIAPRWQSFRTCLQENLANAWGAPEDDPQVRDGEFHFAAIERGKAIIAVQPERGEVQSRDADYHDLSRIPRHAYVAFYLWLRHAGRPCADPHGRAWHAGMAARQVGGAVGSLLAGGADRRRAGDLSLHRQRSRRGRAGQAPHRRRHHRPSAAAACRKRLAAKSASARAIARRIFHRRWPRSRRGASAWSPRSATKRARRASRTISGLPRRPRRPKRSRASTALSAI